MKNIVFVIFLLQSLWIANGCKKKVEEKPYEPVKATFTDIPGTDAYIANTDSSFVDTGLVITVKGKGFDPAYKKHYTIDKYYNPVRYSYKELPEEPKMIYFDESTIVFKYPRNHFYRDYDYCNPTYFNFTFIKYSDDGVVDVQYQKRYLAASPPKQLTLENYYEIFKDSTEVMNNNRMNYQSDFFIRYHGDGSCNLSLYMDNKYLTSLNNKRTGILWKADDFFHEVGIPLDSNYKISDGYHTFKLFKNGKEVFRDGSRLGVYVKNVK